MHMHGWRYLAQAGVEELALLLSNGRALAQQLHPRLAPRAARLGRAELVNEIVELLVTLGEAQLEL